jgi:hypothetical protein
MQVAFWAEMASAQESALEWALEPAVESAVCIGWAEVRLYLCVSSVPPDFMRCYFTKEDIRPFDFDEALLGVVLLQPSTCYAQETQHPGSSLLRLRCEVSFQILNFLYSGARKLAFGHFAHIQCQAHVGLFELYVTSLPCHSSRHVENL